MPWLAAADELMIISSRLAEVQILRTSNMHCSSGVSGAYLRTRLALGLDGGVFDLEGLRQHLYDATTYRFRRSEEHTSELQSLMRISYAVFCLKKKKNT